MADRTVGRKPSPRRKGRRRPVGQAPSTGSLLTLVGLGWVLLALAYGGLRHLAAGDGNLAEGRADGDRIEIRNGCGVPGVAARIRKQLIDLGFDVVGTGNADDFNYEESVLVDLKGNRQRADELARLIGVRAVIQQIDLRAYADYALIVGRDHQKLKRDT